MLVEFEACGGVRMVASAVGLRPEDLRIGMTLEVFVERTGGDEGFGIPRFRQARRTSFRYARSVWLLSCPT